MSASPVTTTEATVLSIIGNLALVGAPAFFIAGLLTSRRQTTPAGRGADALP